MLYMVTFTINISPMLAYIPYMDPMGNIWDVILPSDFNSMIFQRGRSIFINQSMIMPKLSQNDG